MVTADATGLPANDIQRKTYSHTRAGDIERITDQKRGIAYSYAYDALHRLTAETNTGGSPANNYAYNAIGNITRSMGKDTRTYAYGLGGRPHAVKEIRVNGIPYTFTYDNNGNMTLGRDLENPAQAATRTITYNADNMPTRITHSAKGTTDLVYDGTGGRVKKTSGASTTYYIGGHFEVINGIATKYIFAGNTRVAMVKAGQTLYFHQDHLGSSSAMSNAAGKVVETTEHQPYGAVRSRTGVEASNYNFTGQEADPGSGLYNYNARLYDPATGMFISADTIVPNFSDPQSLNRYMYARGNPMAFVDPSGHSWLSDWTGIHIGFNGGFHFRIDKKQFSSFAVTAAASVLVGGTVGGYIGGELAGAGYSATISSVAGGAAGGMAAGATAGGLSSAFHGGNIMEGALAGAGWGGIIGGSLGYFGVPDFSPFGDSAIGSIGNRLFNSGLVGAGFGAAYAGISGENIGQGAMWGAASWAGGEAANMAIGHAVGFIASGGKGPTFSNGAFVYDANTPGWTTFGNVITGPESLLDNQLVRGGLNVPGETFRSHEMGHMQQSILLGPAYIPANAVSLTVGPAIGLVSGQGAIYGSHAYGLLERYFHPVPQW